jgi:hypothetical protein
MMMQAFNIFLLLWVWSFGALAQLPDTGQTSCFTSSSSTDCASDASFPRQDGSLGSAPAYTKLDASGNALDAAAPTWTCVRDNATGLTWETKTTDGGLFSVEHRHLWFNPLASQNGGEAGSADVSDTCGNTIGLACNTANYVGYVNESGYCGATDWRVPTQTELLTLVHAGNLKPSIDTNFFPNTASVPYWSSTTYAMTPSYAWGVHFGYGAAHAESKSAPNAVRLVRGTWVK